MCVCVCVRACDIIHVFVAIRTSIKIITIQLYLTGMMWDNSLQ